MRRWVFASTQETDEPRSVVAVLAAAAPGVVLATVVLADWATPAASYRFLVPLLIAVPALAAASWGIRGTVVFIALSFAVHVMLAFVSGRAFADEQSFYGGLLGLVVISVVSVLPGHLHGRQERKVERLRTVAETVQRAILTPVPEQVGGLRTSAAYCAADEEARIGGDLYEVLETPYGVRMIVGDATGKGMDAVEAAASLLGTFREAAYHTPHLPTLVEWLEDSVRRNNIRHDGGLHEQFITATIISVPDGPVAEMVRCGHPGPLLLRRGGEVAAVDTSRPALPLGLGELTRRGYPVGTVHFDVGDRLLLYTDGVSEARDARGAFYPLAERAAAWADNDPHTLVRNVARDLSAFTAGKFNDDVALLACERVSRFPARAAVSP